MPGRPHCDRPSEVSRVIDLVAQQDVGANEEPARHRDFRLWLATADAQMLVDVFQL